MGLLGERIELRVRVVHAYVTSQSWFGFDRWKEDSVSSLDLKESSFLPRFEATLDIPVSSSLRTERRGLRGRRAEEEESEEEAVHFVCIAVAKVDQDWGEPDHPLPANTKPQSHVVNARTVFGYRSGASGHEVLGKLWWASEVRESLDVMTTNVLLT